MKIIALLMIKNEAWVLPTYLSAIKPMVDEIIAIDDGSDDGSRQILREAGATVLENKEVLKSGTPEYSMRQKLLQTGREHGGTHFVCLDADEALSAVFRANARELIKKLKPGQKYVMQWVFLWKDPNLYIDDKRSYFNQDNYKDFVFCDMPDMQHTYSFMHVGRTPGDNAKENLIKLNPDEGVCVHFTFVNWKRCMLKQAWCRCSDLIEQPKNYIKINSRYYFPAQGSNFKLSEVPKQWLEGLIIPQNTETLPLSWHWKTILGFFDKYGIEFFEPLEIWDISEFHDEFVTRVGREPRSSKLHIYLQPLVKLRRKIKSLF